MESLHHSKSSISIMIVEDDNDARDMLILMLKMKNPESKLYAAENGRIGLELFKKNPADIVLTDVNMPEMTGIEMANSIRSIKADTKLIVLTAYNERVFFEKFNDIGFSDYVLKPIDFKKLFGAIEECVADIRLKQFKNASRLCN
jgi:YesN/AraC family two-component response regulator